MNISGIGGGSSLYYLNFQFPVTAPGRTSTHFEGQDETRKGETANDNQQQSSSQTPENSVRLSLSPDAQKLLGVNNGQEMRITTTSPQNAMAAAAATPEYLRESRKRQSKESDDESKQRTIDKLKARDTEVRSHEGAHAASAGSLAVGGPRYEYQTGPDGKQYVIGGSVDINTSSIPGNPEATLAKARQIRQAATNVSSPSGADMSVAAAASQMEMKAASEVNGETRNDTREAIRMTGPASFGTGGMAAHVESVYAGRAAKGSLVKVYA